MTTEEKMNELNGDIGKILRRLNLVEIRVDQSIEPMKKAMDAIRHNMVNVDEYTKAVNEAARLREAAQAVINDLGSTGNHCLKKLNEALHPMVVVAPVDLMSEPMTNLCAENARLRSQLEEAQKRTPHNYVHKQMFEQVRADMRNAIDRASAAECKVQELTKRLEDAEGSRDPELSYVTLLHRNENLKHEARRQEQGRIAAQEELDKIQAHSAERAAEIASLRDTVKDLRSRLKTANDHIAAHCPPKGTERWNIIPKPSGALEICKGEHAIHEPCKFEVFVPYAEVEAAYKRGVARVKE